MFIQTSYAQVRCKDSDSDNDSKSGNSQSSHLSMEESPPYSRRKSGHDSRNGFVYRNNLAVTQSQGESPYEIKSGRGLVKTDGSFAALKTTLLNILIVQ